MECLSKIQRFTYVGSCHTDTEKDACKTVWSIMYIVLSQPRYGQGLRAPSLRRLNIRYITGKESVIKGVLKAETRSISVYQHRDAKQFRRMKSQMFRNPCTCIFSHHRTLRRIPSICLHSDSPNLILSAWWWSRRRRIHLFTAMISAWRLL